ncbi:MAG: C39 family peptidase [Kiritimatiellia bacterium]
MKHRIPSVWAGLVAIGLLTACFAPMHHAYLLDVPFVAQPDDHCGPASVTMVARFYGVEPDLEKLEQDVFVPALAGSIPDLLAEGARRQGLAAEVVHCEEPQLHEWLAAGFPLILLLAPVGKDPRGHFVVATGSQPATSALRVHSGNRQDRWLVARRWKKRWHDAGNKIVLIRPAESTANR